jgi:hypothetical protein
MYIVLAALAAMAAALVYIFAHDVFHVLDITIFNASVVTAASIGALMIGFALRQIWKFWL